MSETGEGRPLTLRLRELVTARTRGLRAASLTPFLVGHCACRLDAEPAFARVAEGARLLEDIARDPRDADLLVVAGAVNERLAPMVERVWRQMPAPRRVLAWGHCAVSGGLFCGAASGVLQGVDRLLPVDVQVPGCPPDDAALDRALKLLVADARPRRRRPAPGDSEEAWRFGGPEESS